MMMKVDEVDDDKVDEVDDDKVDEIDDDKVDDECNKSCDHNEIN